MDRRALVIIAIFLAALMLIVANAGLDDLPRNLRERVAVASRQLDNDRDALRANRERIDAALRDQPELFAGKADGFHSRLDQDAQRLNQAADALARVQSIAKANRRSDSGNVEQALDTFDRLRSEPVNDSAALKTQAEQAVYDKLHPFDKEVATAPVRKAILDWPDKKTDLESRLASVTDRQTAAQLNSLVAQLYTSWDKLLLKIEGDRQRVRIIQTTAGETRTEEKTESRSPAIGREYVGMVIEHKPAGKYDSEVNRTPQPPAYAYIAPPGQSNAYGHWNNGVWTWLPQYLILSQLLHATHNPPIIRHDDYYGWNRTCPVSPPVVAGPIPRPAPQPDLRQPGNSRWNSPFGNRGLDSSSGNNSSSGWWKERPKPPSGGTFDSSKYRSRGSYSGSRYQSKGTFKSFGRRR